MSDVLLNETTHDIDISSLDLQLVTGKNAIAQNLKIRLWFFLEEWFLDTSVGMPFFQLILIKNPNIESVDAIIKSEILDVPGVNELLSYDSTYDPSLRKFTVDFNVDTNEGEINFSGTLP